MEFTLVHIILAGIAVLFALLEFIIHFHKGELRPSGKFPFFAISVKKRSTGKSEKRTDKKKGPSKLLEQMPDRLVLLHFAPLSPVIS